MRRFAGHGWKFRFLLTLIAATALLLGSVAYVTYASDVLFGPNVQNPISVAAGFDASFEPRMYVSRNLTGPTNIRLYNPNGSINTSFATLPGTGSGLKTHLVVNTGQSSTFTFLNLFAARGLEIFEYTSAGALVRTINVPSSVAAGAICSQVTSLEFDRGLFGEDLLLSCAGTSNGSPATHILRVNAAGATSYVATIASAETGRLTIAPKYWRNVGLHVLIYNKTTDELVAVSPNGIAATFTVGLGFGGLQRASAYAIPPIVAVTKVDTGAPACTFNGGALIGTDFANDRMVRFLVTSFVTRAGDVLLITENGTRVEADSGQGGFSTFEHPVPVEDTGWCPIISADLKVFNTSVGNPNPGAGSASVAILSIAGPPAFNPVTDVVQETVRCGDGIYPDNPVNFSGNTSDENGDGIGDLHGHFKTAGSGLTPGQLPVCTGDTVGNSHDFDAGG